MTQEHPQRTVSKARWQIPVLIVLIAIVVASGVGIYRHAFNGYRLPPVAFDDDSSTLRRTDVAATLEAPIAPGRSVVWSAAFQTAWEQLVDVVGEPIVLTSAPETVERLNNAPSATEAVSAGQHFATVGPADEEIESYIRNEMRRRFPHAAIPEFYASGEGLVLYSFLGGTTFFPMPYFEYPHGAEFTDSAGQASRVLAFGVRPEDAGRYAQLRRQVRVLHHATGREGEAAEYVVDLGEGGSDHQVILARIAPAGTLAGTLDRVEALLAESQLTDDERQLGLGETLLVPTMFWRIHHRFRQIEGPLARLANNGFEQHHIAVALQTLEFRLDRSGAELPRQDPIPGVAASPRSFHFDGPFLLILRRREADPPFLVMWVDNAELLSRPLQRP